MEDSGNIVLAYLSVVAASFVDFFASEVLGGGIAKLVEAFLDGARCNAYDADNLVLGAVEVVHSTGDDDCSSAEATRSSASDHPVSFHPRNCGQVYIVVRETDDAEEAGRWMKWLYWLTCEYFKLLLEPYICFWGLRRERGERGIMKMLLGCPYRVGGQCWKWIVSSVRNQVARQSGEYTGKDRRVGDECYSDG